MAFEAEFSAAETHFRKAIERPTDAQNHDGETVYSLGLLLRHQLDSN
jgi:hypothetical protein